MLTPMLRNAVAFFQIPFWSFLFAASIGIFFHLSYQPFHISEFIFKIGLFFLPAIFYSLIFNTLFVFIRVVSSLFNRFELFWAYATPGIILFQLIVEPFFTFLQLTSTVDSGPYLYLYGIGAGLIALPFILIFPVFRGSNATFLIFSLLVMRIAGSFFDQPWPGTEPWIFLWNHAWFSLLSFFLFASFHMRNLVYLTPGYERPVIPAFIFFTFFVLFIISTGLSIFYFYGMAFGFPGWIVEFASKKIGIMKMGIPLLILNAWLLQWILWSFVIQKRVSQENPASPGFLDVFLPFFTILILASPALLFTLFRPPFYWKFPPGSLEYFSLTRYGIYFDRDRDGNSLWPGQDPDDQNPCIRKDFQLPCSSLKQKEHSGPELPDQSIHDAFENARNAGNIRPGPIRQGSMFVLSTNLSWNNILRSNRVHKAVTAFQIKGDRREGYYTIQFNELLMPFNNSLYSLSALLSNQNGIDFYNRSAKQSVLSHLSMAGYRTVCSFTGGLKTNPAAHDFPLANLPGPDRGCQIFENTKSNPENTGIMGAYKIFQNLKNKYKEFYNFNVLYYEDRDSSITVDQVLDMVLHETEGGPLLLVLFHPNQTLTGEVLLFNKMNRFRSVRASSNLDYFSQLQKNRMENEQTSLIVKRIILMLGMDDSIIHSTEKSYSATGVFVSETETNSAPWKQDAFFESTKEHTSLPIQTYRNTKGGLEVFDALRGTVRFIEPQQ